MRDQLPLVFVDCETTGIDPNSHTAIEVAAVAWNTETGYSAYQSMIHVDPETKFSWAAMAVNHITPEALSAAPNRAQVMTELRRFIHSVPNARVVSFSADFDKSFLPELQDLPWICALRLARHVWPNAESHKNFALYYGLELHKNRPQSGAAHRALADAVVTSEVVFEAISQNWPLAIDIQTLESFVSSPIAVSVLRYGKKHWGMPLTEVPTSYFEWAIREGMKMDADTIASIKVELCRRGRPSAA